MLIGRTAQTLRRAVAMALGGATLMGCAATAPRSAAVVYAPAPMQLPDCREPRGLLWEISAPHRDPAARLFLLGSLHLATPAMFPLAPAVEDAFARSGALAVEVDVLAARRSRDPAVVQMERLGSGERLSDRVGSATADRLRAFLEQQGLPPTAYDGLTPWAAAFAVYRTRLAAMGYSADQGVELYLLRRAAGTKPVVELEGLQRQFEVLGQLGPADQEALLNDALRDPAELAGETRRLVAAWCAGDAAQLADAIGAEKAPTAGHQLVTERNRDLTAALARLLQGGGNWFAAIGAAHLVGSSSVVTQLKALGYSTRRVELGPGAR